MWLPYSIQRRQSGVGSLRIGSGNFSSVACQFSCLVSQVWSASLSMLYALRAWYLSKCLSLCYLMTLETKIRARTWYYSIPLHFTKTSIMMATTVPCLPSCLPLGNSRCSAHICERKGARNEGREGRRKKKGKKERKRKEGRKEEIITCQIPAIELYSLFSCDFLTLHPADINVIS